MRLFEIRIRTVVIARSASDEAIQLLESRRYGLLRGACHRARIRATRWLAMTDAWPPHSQPSSSAKRTIQYSRAVAMKSKDRGVLDRPVKPDDDSCVRSDEGTEASPRPAAFRRGAPIARRFRRHWRGAPPDDRTHTS